MSCKKFTDKVIFCAMSKKTFYLREHIVKFVLEKGHTPTCAFMMFSYFLLDTVDRKALIDANNELICRSDELWVFGPISDGVQAEVDLAKQIKKSVRYYSFDPISLYFNEIDVKVVAYE